ncbi:hypothetical protein [Streptomyces niger]|uniref:hypothetical protein n=1 Tax=Streptomyces niger TaxID=66373 RepID=UPI00069ACC28|nr:hypothetical protein [Streptomyces niger]
MLNPIDTDAVIRDGHASGRVPDEIHAGVAWWVGACFVVVSKARHIAVAYDHHPLSAEFLDRFCRGATNAQHYACRVSTLEPSNEPDLRYAMADLGDVPGVLITTTGDAGQETVTITLYGRDGWPLTDDNGLRKIRTMIDTDRVPIPVNDGARGRIEPYPAPTGATQ